MPPSLLSRGASLGVDGEDGFQSSLVGWKWREAQGLYMRDRVKVSVLKENGADVRPCSHVM
jgi:hypothetical protein